MTADVPLALSAINTRDHDGIERIKMLNQRVEGLKCRGPASRTVYWLRNSMDIPLHLHGPEQLSYIFEGMRNRLALHDIL
jgi:hypothetical protein